VSASVKTWSGKIYCVSTATLVAPRTAPEESTNCTKMRLLTGSNGIAPLAVPKTARRQRFIDATREAGASEDEAVFRENLKRLAKPKPEPRKKGD